MSASWRTRYSPGELKPGDKLPPAKELCELMGVSLTVVNAGMSELANNGFVETIPRRGTYIADYKKKGNAGTLSAIMRYNGGKLSSKEIRALCETRMALDLLVARWWWSARRMPSCMSSSLCSTSCAPSATWSAAASW